MDHVAFREKLAAELGNPPDLIFRETAWLMVGYIDGIADAERVGQELLRSDQPVALYFPELHGISDATKTLVTGDAVIFEKNGGRLLRFAAAAPPHREIGSPQTETVINGAAEGFTEQLDQNLAMLRRRMPTERLQLKHWTLGEEFGTKVCLLFLANRAAPDLVAEVSKRLDAIQSSAVLESNYIAEMICGDPLCLFPTIQHTERPDVVTGALNEGKVCIITANTPVALIAPFSLWSAFQSNEDYNISYSIASFLRLVRFMFVSAALLMPSLYVAITTYHPEMLPTAFLLSVAAARESVPFPALVEALLMEITFEGVLEAMVRMPKAISQAISIVGVLVIGQSAVQAGIVSVPMVIVVSITGVSTFVIPRFAMTYTIRVLRFGLLMLAGTLGLFGVICGLLLIGMYLTGIQSLGTPYLEPIAPFYPSRLKDVFIRAKLTSLDPRRPAKSGGMSGDTDHSKNRA